MLRRYEPGGPLLEGPAVVGSAGRGRLRDTVTAVLKDAGVTVLSPVVADGDATGEKLGAVVLDATGVTGPADLAAAHDFLAPAIKRLRANGRVVILTDPPASRTPRRRPPPARPSTGSPAPSARSCATARRRTRSTCPRARRPASPAR